MLQGVLRKNETPADLYNRIHKKQYQGDNQILENIICPSDQGQGGSTTNGSYLKTGILLLVAFFL